MRAPRVYHKPRFLPRQDRHMAPNERVIEVHGFATYGGCTISVIEGERGIQVRITDITDNCMIAVENARREAA